MYVGNNKQEKLIKFFKFYKMKQAFGKVKYFVKLTLN